MWSRRTTSGEVVFFDGVSLIRILLYCLASLLEKPTRATSKIYLHCYFRI